MTVSIKYFSYLLIFSIIIYILFHILYIFPSGYGNERMNIFYFIGLILLLIFFMGIPYIVSFIITFYINIEFKFSIIINIIITAFYLYFINLLFFKCWDFCVFINDWIKISISHILTYIFFITKK